MVTVRLQLHFLLLISVSTSSDSDSVECFFQAGSGKACSQRNNNTASVLTLNRAQFSGSWLRRHSASQTGSNRDPVSAARRLDRPRPLGGTPFSGISFLPRTAQTLNFQDYLPPPASPQNLHIWLSDGHSWQFSWNFLVKMWIIYSGKGTCLHSYYHKRVNASWIF